MTDALRPWISLAIGAMSAFQGIVIIRRAAKESATRIVDPSEPTSGKPFGTFLIILGLAMFGLAISSLLSE